LPLSQQPKYEKRKEKEALVRKNLLLPPTLNLVTVLNAVRNNLLLPPTLNLATILNVGTLLEGTPFSDFSIFAPLHTFFGIKKNRAYDPNLALETLFQAFTQ
jgi:hypothetical protein